MKTVSRKYTKGAQAAVNRTKVLKVVMQRCVWTFLMCTQSVSRSDWIRPQTYRGNNPTQCFQDNSGFIFGGGGGELGVYCTLARKTTLICQISLHKFQLSRSWELWSWLCAMRARACVCVLCTRAGLHNCCCCTFRLDCVCTAFNTELINVHRSFRKVRQPRLHSDHRLRHDGRRRRVHGCCPQRRWGG